MIFANLRFYRKDGQYYTIQVGFSADDLTGFIHKLEAFRQGYRLGGGSIIGWDQINPLKSTLTPYYSLPEQTNELIQFLKEKGYHGQSNSSQDQGKA